METNQEFITTELKKFNVADAAIAEMKQQYMTLTIAGLDDVKGYKIVHDARMIVKNKRVEVEKKRKELKADALKFGQMVDGEAKRITALLTPIEEHLEKQEKTIDDEKELIRTEAERKKKERFDSRKTLLYEAGMRSNGTVLEYGEHTVSDAEIEQATDEQFIKFCEMVSKAKTEDDKKKQEETDRITKIQAEQEVEAARLKAIAEEQSKKETELKAAQEKLESEKLKAETEKRHAEGLDQARKEATEKAQKDAEELIKTNEARVKAEAEQKEAARLAAIEEAKRQAELAPDKIKLENFCNEIAEVTCAKLESKKANTLYSEHRNKINLIINELRTKIKTLK